MEGPDEARKERNQRLVIIIGTLVMLGAIIAVAVLYGSGDTSTADPSELSAPVGASGLGVVVGRSSAPHVVVVHEGPTDQVSRAWDISTRDFLRRDAAQGRVRVTYLPSGGAAGSVASRQATSTFRSLLRRSPRRALAFRDRTYDAETARATRPARSPLTVTLDGRPVARGPAEGAVPALAARLERALAR